MKNKARLVFLVAGVFVFLLSGTALAEDFSADMINTTHGRVFKGKIFVSKDKMRMETPENITITRMDKKVIWILMPKEKTYMEQAFDPSYVVTTQEKLTGEIERKLVGQENIGGRMAKKYRVVYNQGGRVETVFQWIVAGLKIPVKTAAGDNSWTMEYKNIKMGKQPPALFEIPAGYQKFSYQMPSMKDMLKGLGR